MEGPMRPAWQTFALKWIGLIVFLIGGMSLIHFKSNAGEMVQKKGAARTPAALMPSFDRPMWHTNPSFLNPPRLAPAWSFSRETDFAGNDRGMIGTDPRLWNPNFELLQERVRFGLLE